MDLNPSPPPKNFFHRIHQVERKSYTFYSNSSQILYLIATFSGNTSTRVVNVY